MEFPYSIMEKSWNLKAQKEHEPCSGFLDLCLILQPYACVEKKKKKKKKTLYFKQGSFFKNGRTH